MLFDIVPILLIFGAAMIIVVVVGRRLPDIASINVETLPEAQAAAKKRQLLIQRLERNVRSATSRMWQSTAPLRGAVRGRAGSFYDRLLVLEDAYRPAKRSRQPVNVLLADAERERLQGNDEVAEKLYLEVIAADHHNGRAYRGLGVLYHQKGQYEEARQALQHATKINPNDAGSYAELARIATAQGKLADARHAYEEAVRLRPRQVQYYIDLGDVTLAMGDAKAAVEAFAAAADLESANPRCLDRLLEASILVGRKKLAVGTLKRLAEVNPDNRKLADFAARVEAIPVRVRKAKAEVASSQAEPSVQPEVAPSAEETPEDQEGEPPVANSV